MADRRRRLRLLRFTELLAAVVLILGPGLVYAGVTEPYISPPTPVFGDVDVLVLMIGGAGLIWLRPSKFLRRRYWQATAAEAGLTTGHGDTAGSRECTGTIRGRLVRVKTGTTTAFRSSTKQTRESYTLVEAELDRAASAGVVIGPSAQDTFVTPYDVASHADCERNGLVAVGSSDGLAEAVLTTRVQEALLPVEPLNQVYVGNARAAGDRLPEGDRMVVGTPPSVTRAVDAAHSADMEGGDWLGGNRWVTHLSRDVTLDAEKLRRQVEAIAIVADVFEETERQEAPSQ